MRETGPVEYISLEGRILKETEKALLMSIFTVEEVPTVSSPNDLAPNEWIPLSQIKSIDHKGPEHENDVVQVAKWVIERKGLI